jgi:hypothetical protein
VIRHRSADGKRLPAGETGERVCFSDLGIPEAYRAARRPVSAAGQVTPLRLTPQEIRDLAARAAELSNETP